MFSNFTFVQAKLSNVAFFHLVLPVNGVVIFLFSYLLVPII